MANSDSWIDSETSDPDSSAVSAQSDNQASDSDQNMSEAQEKSAFERQVETITESNGTIAISLLEDGVPDVEDPELLENLLAHVGGQEEKERLVESRMKELGIISDDGTIEDDNDSTDDAEAETDESSSGFDDIDDGSTDESSDETTESSGFDDVEDGVTGEADKTTESSGFDDVDDGSTNNSDSDDSTADSGFVDAADSSDETADGSEVSEESTDDSSDAEKSISESFEDATGEVESDAASETADSSGGDQAVEPANGGSTSVEDEIGADTPTVDETDADPEPPEPDDLDSAESESIDAILQEGGGMSVEEAVEKEKRQSVLVWAHQGKGKTHFSYTMPGPIWFIDTENKADVVASDFADKNVQIQQVKNYDEARKALERGLKTLEKVYEETGVVGTIVVDSMSEIWEWSKQKYVEMFYPDKDAEHVELGYDADLDDWKKIKEYHNKKFRQKIVNSRFHFCWTQMAKDDIQRSIEEDLEETPLTPEGEKNNKYKVSETIHIYECPDTGRPMGELHKSDRTRLRYTGLKWPTFEKHRNLIDAIRDFEADKRSQQSVQNEFGVSLVDGHPMTLRLQNSS